MTEDNDNWYRLTVLLEAEHSVDAAAILWEFDPAGVETHDAATYADDDTIAAVPEGTERLVAYYHQPNPAAANQLEQTVVNALSEAGILPLSIQYADYTDRQWESAWKDYFEPTEICERAVVGPPWEQFSAPDGATKLIIEPGMAFGTGTHETTQMCAGRLDGCLAETDAAPSVLDVGCGSAILSMVARRLGARRVLGIDVDETAIEVASKNLDVNQLSDDVELSTTPVDQVDGHFEVVVANILAHVLIHVADALKERVAGGGRLILSGIGADQMDDIRAAFVDDSFAEIAVDQRGEWVCVELRRENR